MSEQVQKPEGIRQWYRRTTSTARKVLLWSTVVAIVGAVIAFFFLPAAAAMKIQTFNSALVIPIAALLWTVGLVFIFLLPQREAAFRSQEWVETLVTTVVPAIKKWSAIADSVNTELPGVLAQMKSFTKNAAETMEDLRAAARRLTEAVAKNEMLASDAKPAIEALKRIEARIEFEIKMGLFENVNTALESIRGMSGVPQGEEDMGNLQWALESVRKSKVKVGGNS